MNINYENYSTIKTKPKIIMVRKAITDPRDPALLDPVIFNVSDLGAYQEMSGEWADDNVTGYEGSLVRYTNDQVGFQGAYSEWSYEIEKTSNYDVFVWFPFKDPWNGYVLYEVETSKGKWAKHINQIENAEQWVKIATVDGLLLDTLNIRLYMVTNYTSTRANAVKIAETNDLRSESLKTKIFMNLSGFDVDKPKRATIPNGLNSEAFTLNNASDNAVVYTGTILNEIADFSDFITEGNYYLTYDNELSYEFIIGKYLMQKVSVIPALNFMNDARQDLSLSEENTTGYAWRDSHQFSFEMHTLVFQYMANPSLYERLPYSILKVEECMYPELRVQNEPDIIWLFKWAMTSYYDDAVNKGVDLHAFIKSQIAYFLYIYPSIKDYVTESFYIQMRDLAVNEWANPLCNKQWYELGVSINDPDNNLFDVQKYIGDVKGAKPPGYAIVPNLLMYEVLTRDGLLNAQDYMDAAYNNCEWLVNNIDLTDPKYTKGQRMSEHITMTALSYFYENYELQAPTGLLTKVNEWADTMIARSNNIWDFRKHSDPSIDGTKNRWTVSDSMNEPGNLAGFPASVYSAIRIMTDETKKDRLKEIAIAQIDNLFGRNPYGRPAFYHNDHVEGLDIPWFGHFTTGVGDLKWVRAVLDGSPKEAAYPNNPDSSLFGYSEGWVAFNTAWNHSLAYQSADELELNVYEETFTTEITNATIGQAIGIRLKAPLNFNYNLVETGEVIITDSNGIETKLTATEESVNDYYFSNTYTIPSGITFLDISYGIGIFKHSVMITIS